MIAKISIIIPTCDRPNILIRAIDSAMNQSRPAAEIIVIDDGSSKMKYVPNIKFLKTNGYVGPAAARNFGVIRSCSKSNAICYLDDDDELMPNYIETQSSIIENNNVEFAFSKALYKYEDKFETTDPEPNNHGHKRYYDNNALLDQNIAPISSFIHTKDAFYKIGGWDESLLKMEDWDFWARMYLAHGVPFFIDKITNIIHKGKINCRSDSNPFAYSMSCSWRDVVSDKIKYMYNNNIFNLSKNHRFCIPKLGLIAISSIGNTEQKILEIENSGYNDYEIIVIDNDGKTCNHASSKIRKFTIEKKDRSKSITELINYGMLLSRSELIGILNEIDVKNIVTDSSELLKNKRITFSRENGIIRRKVIEIIGGLDEKLYWKEAMRKFFCKIKN